MDRAYTADYQLIKANEAFKGRSYFCPICNGTLHFYPGTTNVPHFRHGKGVPEEIKTNCELYSQGFGESSLFDEELLARQRVRLVLNKIDQEYMFQLKFPIIRQSNVNVNIHIDNLYYTYQCREIPELKLNSVRLLPTRKASEEEVPLLDRYTFICSNHLYEKRLGLNISGIYEPLLNGPLIFKEIQGQFISIPYRKITLSGRFFIVSSTPVIHIHPDLELISQAYYDNYYLYELNVPTYFSDNLQNWFLKVISYTLLPATCHLDILPPISFKKNGSTVELNSRKSFWLLTNIGIRHKEQRVILEHPNFHRQVLKVPNNQIVELDLQNKGYYQLYIEQEITEILTILYNPELEHTFDFDGQAAINNRDALFTFRDLNINQIEFESNLNVLVTTETDINYEIKSNATYTFNSPIRVDFPTLWSINVHKTLEFSSEIEFESILSLYERHYLYPKVICLVEEIRLLQSIVMNSDFIYKDKILYNIRRFGLRVPKPVGEVIKEMRHF
ncbi:hypothetical protein IHV12_17670 [Fictibacillus sp. 7GRE50]|uniref:hypothetical protein n=1 Tax=Fictibacillus sp. 7GRE50 TaxID=2745878 RepID=UPI0018CECF62|nr:hypothetical protein [Fictibacillus sp. 7GRE50]MBH0166753.1 hypothetical protein [Fictibacillus sp. 7GRE50]